MQFDVIFFKHIFCLFNVDQYAHAYYIIMWRNFLIISQESKRLTAQVLNRNISLLFFHQKKKQFYEHEIENLVGEKIN